MGNYLTQFTDFVDNAAKLYVTGPKQVVNELISRSGLASMFWYNRSFADVVRTGPRIRDTMLLQGSSTFRAYRAGQKRERSIANGGVAYTAPWAFWTSYIAWDETMEELIDADGRDTGTKEGIFKRVYDQLEGIEWADITEGLDDAITAVPDKTLMEGEDMADEERQPMSLFAIVNEYQFGLFGRGLTGAGAPLAWTTKYGLDPAKAAYRDKQGVSRLAPYFGSYTKEDPFASGTPATSTDIVTALDEMADQLQFETPSMGAEHFPAQTPISRKKLLTSDLGVKQLRRNLDVRRDRQRPVGNAELSDGDVVFRGQKVHRHPKIGARALYINAAGTGLATENSGGANNGPRYYMIDTDHLRPMIHADRVFEQCDVREEPGSISESRFYRDRKLWWQVWTSSFRRHGTTGPR